jgi:hypothetical protein
MLGGRFGSSASRRFRGHYNRRVVFSAEPEGGDSVCRQLMTQPGIGARAHSYRLVTFDTGFFALGWSSTNAPFHVVNYECGALKREAPYPVSYVSRD